MIEAVRATERYGTESAAARALGIPRPTLHNRLEAARLDGVKPTEKAEEGPQRTELDLARDRILELDAQLKGVKSETLTDAYVKRKIIGLREDADQVKPPGWSLTIPRGKGLPGVPVTLWSDWHWGEVVDPEQINGVNEYSLAIAHRRARTLVSRIVELLFSYAPGGKASYPGIVVCLGGDMVSGDIHEELSETNEVPAMPCILDLYAVLIWGLQTLADRFGKVFVPCVTGNHGRMTKKPRAKGRAFTNFDWLLYRLLQKHFEGDKRIQFFIPDGPDALFTVVGHRYLLTHGDQFRGGDGMIGPIGPLTRGRQKKLSRNAAVGREFDTMIHGHYHTYSPTPRLIGNGSLKGYDEYANANNFGFELPIQALWLTHPEHGITIHMPTFLEKATTANAGADWIGWKDAA